MQSDGNDGLENIQLQLSSSFKLRRTAEFVHTNGESTIQSNSKYGDSQEEEFASGVNKGPPLLPDVYIQPKTRTGIQLKSKKKHLPMSMSQEHQEHDEHFDYAFDSGAGTGNESSSESIRKKSANLETAFTNAEYKHGNGDGIDPDKQNHSEFETQDDYKAGEEKFKRRHRSEKPWNPGKNENVRNSEYKTTDLITSEDTPDGSLSNVSITYSDTTSNTQYRSRGVNLTVNNPSKIDRNPIKAKINTPSKAIVVVKWCATVILGLLFLFSLVLNVLSFIGISTRSESDVILEGRSVENIKKFNIASQAFVTVLLVLLIPNFLNAFRSFSVSFFRKDMPWPSRKSVRWIIIISGLESLGMCIFAYKVYQLNLYGLVGLLATQSVYILPIAVQVKYGRRYHTSPWKWMACVAAALIVGAVITLVAWRSYSFLDKNGNTIVNLALLVIAIFLISISWLPTMQKKLLSTRDSTNKQKRYDQLYSSKYQRIGEEGGIDSYEESIVNTMDSTLSTNVSDEEETVHRKRSTWKSTFLLSLFRIPFIFLFSFLVFGLYKSSWSVDPFVSAMKYGWDWQDVTMTKLFVVNICTCVFTYFLGLFMCNTNMQRGGFIIPIVFATPTAIFLLSLDGFCASVSKLLDTDLDTDYCTYEKDDVGFVIPGTVIMIIAMVISIGRILWSTNTGLLFREAQLMWLAAFPGVLMEQWMFLGRKNKWTEDEYVEQEVMVKKSRVYICTTMYHESEKEMEQLLMSLARVSEAQAQSSRHFESHIIFDKGVKDKTLTEYALQLVGLLPKAMNLGPEGIEKVTKSKTPYGMQLSWRLPNSTKGKAMHFTIHLKDDRKVKNKKRWSQIMYMSYVLDFATKQLVNKRGKPQVDEDDAFILTTDADVEFNPDSVEALLDLMTRDKTVGAVCARTHPLGSGPLVWYQKFEYAIGHWFQKAAEHVLGSVLCAPGCFSVYRVSAVRDILSTYASGVDEAYEFLTKDMGEDRWFCTLLVQSGWRIEYCAAAENSTYCPQEFEEFYKQRRRWIASTIANLYLLITEWSKIQRFNHRVSYLFCVYQSLLLFSTVIGPSVVILIVGGGMFYAVGVDSVTIIILQVVMCTVYAMICLKASESSQMMAGKIITFIYACLMMLVAVGTAQQIVEDLQIEKKPESSTVGPNDTTQYTPTLSPSDISWNLPISITTIYLGMLIGIFFVTGLFHPREFFCLLNGFWYLLCLPSGYLVLNIYSICNITDRSWGTRETKDDTVLKEEKNWQEKIRQWMYTIFFCCQPKPEEVSTVSVPGAVDQGQGRTHRTSLSEQTNFTRSMSTDLNATTTSRDYGMVMTDPHRYEAIEEEFGDEDEDRFVPVEDWLDEELQEYLPMFKTHGYDNTMFISSMTKTDLKKIGIKKFSHVNYLLGEIKDLPLFQIETKVPDGVRTWLKEIGLPQYEKVFLKNKMISSKDLEILRSSTIDKTEDILRQDLKISKRAHVKRFLQAVRHLRNPTKEETTRLYVKKKLDLALLNKMEDWGPEENVFWKALTEQCLKPSSDAFGHNENLQGKLIDLRNGILAISAIANALWLILLSVLGSKMDLKVYGADPVGLAFVSAFGFLFIIQFLCMLVHRTMTVGHFFARAPYRFHQSFKSTWSFDDNGHSVDESDRIAQRDVEQAELLARGRLRTHKPGKVRAADKTPLKGNGVKYGAMAHIPE